MAQTAGDLESDGSQTTLSVDRASIPTRAEPVPGAVLIFASSLPAARWFRFEQGDITLGRSSLALGSAGDPLMSRQHARLSFGDSGCLVSDLGSRNGTFVNAQRVTSDVRVSFGGLVRIGGALLIVVPDILPFEHYGLGARDGVVGGPTLRRALEAVTRVARSTTRGSGLLIVGETGTGKEIAARTFHELGPKSQGPFKAVNCATIPKDLAERLLFGSRRGAFSGATDAPGYVQSAHGGSMFLDEIGELPLEVQSKLLRMIETGEALRLGSTRHETVDLRLCAATWRDLREEVRCGRFREDLYFRIGQPEVRLAPLRERVEEIPWHVQAVLDDMASDGQGRLAAAVEFVEACALRSWPGNVRELRGEVRRAALAAAPGTNVLGLEALSERAGSVIASEHGRSAPPSVRNDVFPDDEIAAAMAVEAGNVTSAARRLGVHRNKVRRWLERHQLEARQFKTTEK
jgi:transcriptional regulator with AAA-type ATPase domain